MSYFRSGSSSLTSGGRDSSVLIIYTLRGTVLFARSLCLCMAPLRQWRSPRETRPKTLLSPQRESFILEFVTESVYRKKKKKTANTEEVTTQSRIKNNSVSWHGIIYRNGTERKQKPFLFSFLVYFTLIFKLSNYFFGIFFGA